MISEEDFRRKQDEKLHKRARFGFAGRQSMIICVNGSVEMQGYNCIMVYSSDGKNILFCRRTADPYIGKYNLVGGKIEKDEDGFEAAYRELAEETGITRDIIELRHMMDFVYYNQDCYVEIYVGHIDMKTVLEQEKHPLIWISSEEDFFDLEKFAGEGNIGHMVEQVRIYGEGSGQEE